MKNILMLLIAMTTLQMSAQEKDSNHRKQRQEMRASFSPEETAQLKAKKMTLRLGLDENQQMKVASLFLEQAKTKTVKSEDATSIGKVDRKNVSKEERLKMANARLDRKIALQRKMKTILNEDQFQKYIKMSARNMHKGQKYARHGRKNMNRKTSENSKG